MKNVAIFEDGKIRRGSRAKLIKRGNKRVLIEFVKYDAKTDQYLVVTEWFKLYLPTYVGNKKPFKHNNKRMKASYCHRETNEFYSDLYQTEEFKVVAKARYSPEEYAQIYGEG